MPTLCISCEVKTLIGSENTNYSQRDLVLVVMLYASAPALASLFSISVSLPVYLKLSLHFVANVYIHGLQLSLVYRYLPTHI